MDIFAIVPARGGSKRVPRKNIRSVGGKPLIAHTLEQSRRASEIDRTIVSTDSEEIATVAQNHGGEVPFMRPAELATDEASSLDVARHALDWVRSEGHDPDVLVLLQVTTPLRTVEDIDGAIRTLRDDPDVQSVVSVSEYETPPHWAVECEDGYLRPHFDAETLWGEDVKRSQDVPTLYHPNGCLFAVETEQFDSEATFYTDQTAAYEMPRDRSLDIDEPFDLEIARALLGE
ncbi:acylneuraminate cytidylyltransferase family protein [Halomicrobium sp. IBSBa]|uniref:acylneuraminate cytidylyltransferase family protein n=1 Tax=Halomicrobium sp. IBSBa TaxID=2778916 RepID=UPI001ABF32B7|nr:acylneuraminate cytidylyltransferase family protein [Halomicrobium sp. IBSBa]MBO4249546.1 acylneuraminate cytidylyltransferase family protein [Halomicrobium sp. IBSBa]